MTTWEAALTICGLALVTLVTRAFFLIPEREVPLPQWLQQGLRYAPLAALTAVVVPEVVLTQGHLTSTWQDARLYAVAVSTALFLLAPRTFSGTILTGTATMLTLRLGLGW